MTRLRLIPVLCILALLLTAVPVLPLQRVDAAQGLFNRSLTLSTSREGQSAEYAFQFDVTSATAIGSIQFEFCTEDPLPYEACTPPTGMDISGAALTSQTGEIGFIIDGGATTASNMLITRAPAVATPQTVTYTFDPTINPANLGSYYVRLYTFASNDGSGPSTEEAGIAFAITEGFDVTAFVPPFLEFCVAITVPGPDCATSSGSFVDFGVLSETAVRTGQSQMAAATNGVGGVAISLLGTTMTSGINVIPGLNVRAPSNIGTSQFGLNLRDNTSPNIGLDSTGTGTIVPLGDYGIVNQFTFRSGDVIANSPLSTNFSRLTAAYIVNINSNQAPGVYTTTLTYVATATF